MAFTAMSAMVKRPIILCFIPFYLPGYRSGGPLRTIANMVDHLGDEFDIRIVTRDRDVFDIKPYPEVKVDAWNTLGKAQVFYASKRTITLAGIAQLLRATPHDVLYLNSFFAYGFTLLPLLARRLCLAPKRPCVMAPRGEFSTGALAIKTRKKISYMYFFRLLCIDRNLIWQASSASESADIRSVLGSSKNQIFVASDLPPAISSKIDFCARNSGPFRVAFLSRISPMKNLDYLLNVLHGVSAPISLTIHGPIDDSDYWRLCQSLLEGMPSNVHIEYAGEALHENVSSLLSSADLFVLPTRGENFGHVILEALSVGTPVLISDQTPWRGDGIGGVEELSLEDMNAWRIKIDSWAQYDEATLLIRRKAALRVAQEFLDDPNLIQSTRTLFLRGIQSSSSLACVE